MPASSGRRRGLPTFRRQATGAVTAEVGEFFRVLNELIEFEQFEPQTFLADGDRVVVLGIDRYKVKGGSGKSLSEGWCHVFTMRDGKIVAFEEYIDTAALAAELKAAAARV